MEFWQAITLGFVQGVTEFLPISSSGHLVLVQDLFALTGDHQLTFNVFVHVGTLLAVVVYFWRDLITLSQVLFRKLGRLPVSERDWVLLQSLLVGTIPALLMGLAIGSFIEMYFMFAVPVALSLIAGSCLFIYAEWYHFRHPANRPLSVRTGLLIGCFQILALVPGFSRSGVTLAGGMLLGLTRYEAARFAFLMAIPVIAGASAKMSIDYIAEPSAIAWGSVVVGGAVAFFIAILVIHWFLGFVRRNTLWPFIWYRFALAFLILYKEFLV
jgi:undecaprenyl-diphosphatase